MSRPKILLTDQQKEIINVDICYKSMDYIARETGLSKYKIRQYLKEYHQKEFERLDKLWKEDYESYLQSQERR
jgi:hypothetical protein